MKTIAIFFVLVLQVTANSAPPKKIADIRLHLHSEKKIYKTGEELSLFTFLQNQSADRSYFIGRNINAFGINRFFHSVSLSVKNIANQEMPRPMLAGDPALDALDPKTGQVKLPFSNFQEEYVLLHSGMLFGFQTAVPIRLQPGKYKLKATYYEAAYLQFTADELKNLSAPIWTAKLTSNEVVITVTK